MAKIRYLSLFAGIEAWSCAVKNMPEFEPVAFAEIDPFASAVLAHHYPHVENLGDVTKIDGKALRGKVDLIVGGSPCFVAGTPVLTPSGYRPIEELQIGDEVVSANGNIRKVEATGHKTAPVGKLKILGRPEIVCTPNHPFLCFNVKRDERRKSPTYANILPVDEPRFIAAEQAVGRYACRGKWMATATPVLPNVYGISDADIIELAGWYVGDGTIRKWKSKRKKTVVLSLVSEEKIARFYQRFPDVHAYLDNDRRVNIACTDFAEWLVDNFGEYSYGKRVPYWLYCCKYKNNFLDGYKATDGNEKQTSWKFTTVSPHLAYGIADLGERSSLEFTPRPETHVIQGRVVNQRNTWVSQIYKTETPRTKWFFDRWTSIVRSWIPLNEEQTVYNITVEEDHNYVAAGIAVKNCQGFSVAGLRKGLDDERSCLALTYVRLVDEVRSKWLLWENVPGCFSTNGGQDLRSFFAALNDIGYSLSWTVLNSEFWGVPQRRRRVFLVGHLGADWERPAKVLLEPQSLCGDPPPRRKAGEEHPRPSEGGARERGEQDGGVAQNPTFATLCASGAGCDRPSAQGSQLDYCVVDEQPNKTAPSLTSSGAAFARTGQQGSEVDALVLDKPAFAVRTAQTGANGIGIDEETAHTLDASGTEAVAFAQNQRDEVRQMDIAGALAAEPGMKQTTYVAQKEGGVSPSPTRTLILAGTMAILPTPSAPTTAERLRYPFKKSP